MQIPNSAKPTQKQALRVLMILNSPAQTSFRLTPVPGFTLSLRALILLRKRRKQSHKSRESRTFPSEDEEAEPNSLLSHNTLRINASLDKIVLCDFQFTRVTRFSSTKWPVSARVPLASYVNA